VLTPGCHTIAELAAFLDIPESRTAKAVFFVADDRLIFAVVRGDMDVDEDKVANLTGAGRLRQAQGAFDLNLNAGLNATPFGFYDGRTGSVILEQALQS
jgi:prolyl-tRNA synthetase